MIRSIPYFKNRMHLISNSRGRVNGSAKRHKALKLKTTNDLIDCVLPLSHIRKTAIFDFLAPCE